MSRPIRDEDLLAWIEGDATPEQAAQVEAALADDSKLRAWADGARADRDLLCAWGEPGASMAPSDLVEQAIAMAERSALLDAPASGLYELKTQGGPFRLFTPGRLSIAAGLLVAVSAGILAMPALQGGSRPIHAPAPMAENEGPAIASQDAGGSSAEKSELRIAGADLADGDDAARRDESTLADLSRQLGAAAGRVAMAEPGADESETFADSPVSTPTDARLALGASEAAANGGEALREAAPSAASSLFTGQPIALTPQNEHFDASLNESSVMSKAAPLEVDADAEEKVLALADDAAGWQGVAPQTRPRRQLPALVLIGPGPDSATAGRDANGIESMSLREAEMLARDGLLVVQAYVDSAPRYADAFAARASVANLDLRDQPAGGDGATRVLVVLGRADSVEALLQQVSGAGVRTLSMTRAPEPVATPVDFSSVAWWTLPVDQWGAESSRAVLVEIVDDDGPVDGPSLR